MKFKVYAWHSIYMRDPEYADYHFYLLPSIDFCLNKYNFLPDESFKETRKGGIFCILLDWLFFGVTFDFRWGDAAKEEDV